MSEIQKSTKKNRLTLYIIIGLIAGIALGFWLNSSYVQVENAQLAKVDASIAVMQAQIKSAGDTTSEAYKILVAQKSELAAERSAILTGRDSKLEPFSLIADIFLRLIKMIVAPLVFTTLVVGVAKLGDIKSVGRIGGKTMLWFFSASFVSLLLGMVLTFQQQMQTS